MAKETAQKRHKIDPVVGAKTQFTKKHQPSREAKSKGWQKKKSLSDLLQIKINNPDAFKSLELIKQKFPELDLKGITIEEAADLVIVLEPLLKNNSISQWMAVRDRIYGKPKQPLTGGDGGPLQMQVQVPLTKQEIDELSKQFNDKY